MNNTYTHITHTYTMNWFGIFCTMLYLEKQNIFGSLNILFYYAPVTISKSIHFLIRSEFSKTLCAIIFNYKEHLIIEEMNQLGYNICI